MTSTSPTPSDEQEDMGVTPSGPGSQASPEAGKPSSPSVSIPNAVKSHPDYREGYFDAFNARTSFDTDRAGSEPYCYGYEAGTRAVALFEKHGFTRSHGGGFDLRLRVNREKQS